MHMAEAVHLKTKYLLILLLEIIIGSLASKDVSVIIPLAVRIMDTVTLQCIYDLEGEPLYTVKWYKGPNEFYRYIPKELPNTQIFPVSGINVDLNKSSPNKVILRHVQPEVTGRYKCEVSSDAPNFYTLGKVGYMYVVDVPDEDPILSVEKGILEIGYTLRGNCSSPPSFPAANVTWYLNGKRVKESFTKHIQISSSLLDTTNKRPPTITVSGVELEIDRNTFFEGRAKLLCVATLFDLYRREKDIILEEERPKPRPSSVLGTRDSTGGSPVSSSLSTFIITLVVLNCLPLR